MATRKSNHVNPLKTYTEYNALKNAIARCHNPKHQAYHNYGARGIIVASEWHGDGGFDRFIEHIGWKVDQSLTLDRINNSLGYVPGNVEWATRKRQQNNRRPMRAPTFNKLHMVTFNGKTQNYANWAKELNLQLAAIRQRVDRGLPVEQILAPRQRVSNKTILFQGEQHKICDWVKEHNRTFEETSIAMKRGFTAEQILRNEHNPRRDRVIHTYGMKYTYKGETKPIIEWARSIGMNISTFRDRIIAGWTMEEAIERPVQFQGNRGRKVPGQLLDIENDPCRATVDQAIAQLSKSVLDIETRKH